MSLKITFSNRTKTGLLLSGFLLLLGASSVPSPESSLSPSPVPSATSPSPSPSLIPADWKSLINQFIKAQKTEARAQDHRHRFEIRELDAAQKIKLGEWFENEKKARRQYNEVHTDSKERSAYFRDSIQRRDALKGQLSEERKRRLKEQEMETTSLKKEHSEKLEKFKKLIETHKVPSKELWPRSGG